MQFRKKDIEYIEKLTRIKLSEQERGELVLQLTKILNYVNKLKEVNTDKISYDGYLQESSKKNVLRKDEVKQSLSNKEVLENAPQKEGDFFKVAKIIDN